ncbi:MAG TPA: FAD-dependent oxidoreductase [Puia sp.]|nr:FAD-dependent oxidoreductase [Puia sp.]
MNHDMPTQVDVLIIGQGICGTFLSLELERTGLSYLVIDEAKTPPQSMRPAVVTRAGSPIPASSTFPGSSTFPASSAFPASSTFPASRAAAGLINPVTGRRLVTTWMIDELLAFAQERYGQLASVLGASFLEKAHVTDFFPTAQMRLAFLRRLEEDGSYLRLPENEHNWDGCFHYELGYGIISPCYLVDLPGLLAAARKRMLGQGVLREQRFESGELEVGTVPGAELVSRTLNASTLSSSTPGDGVSAGYGAVRYQDIEAKRIVFCDGVGSFASPYFSRLPFAPNKGEVLIVDIPGLAAMAAGMGKKDGIDGAAAERTIFKKGISLAPWQEGLYWVGSSYEWSFETAGPTEGFRQKTEMALKEWVKLPFRIVDHIAAVRPATLERRPFVGFHPVYPAVGILNGMGTKGCSLAPYFARQLVDYLSKGSPIRADADILRFTKVLSRG